MKYTSLLLLGLASAVNIQQRGPSNDSEIEKITKNSDPKPAPTPSDDDPEVVLQKARVEQGKKKPDPIN